MDINFLPDSIIIKKYEKKFLRFLKKHSDELKIIKIKKKFYADPIGEDCNRLDNDRKKILYKVKAEALGMLTAYLCECEQLPEEYKTKIINELKGIYSRECVTTYIATLYDVLYGKRNVVKFLSERIPEITYKNYSFNDKECIFIRYIGEITNIIMGENVTMNDIDIDNIINGIEVKLWPLSWKSYNERSNRNTGNGNDNPYHYGYIIPKISGLKTRKVHRADLAVKAYEHVKRNFDTNSER